MSRDLVTIERCPHDQENPYAQVNRELIRDKTISPECRMILIWLLSHKDSWRINFKHIRTEFKDYFGRDRVYRYIDEAVEAGYMKREEFFDKNLRRCRYLLSERPKFKKCFRLPEIQDVEGQDADRTDNKEGVSDKKEQQKNVVVSGTPPPIISKQPDPETPQICKDDVHRYAISSKKDWDSQEIDVAWQTYTKASYPVTDVLKYVEGIINNKRIVKHKKQEAKCLKKEKPPKKSPQSNQELENTNTKPLDCGTSEPLLGRFVSQRGRKKE